MAVHDWTRVEAGLYHDFHQRWTVNLSNALNNGVLPEDFFALIEQNIRGPIPDLLTLKLSDEPRGNSRGGIAVAEAPPKTRLIQKSETDRYAELANEVSVRHRRGDVVAVVEIMSPGNKSNLAGIRAFVKKAMDLIDQGIHLLVVDLFPPGPRDPLGIHPLIWADFVEEGAESYSLPPGKPMTLASYHAMAPKCAYVDNVGLADSLPDMPLFLQPGYYVPAPLEATYQQTWEQFPRALKKLLA